MADVRCPMCGKPNPEALEVCQYCQARLKPLTAPLGEPIHPGEEPTRKSTADLEPILPEWLRKARHPEPESDTPAAPGGAGDIPLDDSPRPARQPSQPAPKEPADLLSGLNKQSAEEDEEIPDWLAEIRAGSEAPASQEAAAEPPAQEQSDWLAELRGDDTATGVAPEGEPAAEFTQLGSELPDWLSGVEGESPKEDGLSWTPEAEQTGSVPPQEEILPGAGWLDQEDEGQVASQPPEKEQALPSWLSELKSESVPSEPPAGQEPAPAGEPLESADLPDWLAGLKAESITPAPPEEIPSSHEAPTIPAAAAGLPGWLDGIEEKPSEPSPAPAPSDESVLPSWLSSAMGEPPAPAEAIEQPGHMGELPDWLMSTTPGAANAAGEQPQAPAEPQEIESQEIPDWLTSLPGETTGALPSASVSPFEEETPAQTGGQAPAFSEAAAEPQTEVESAFSMEMPDWLSAIKPPAGQAAPMEAETTPAAGDADIAPAALPSWVQAMRPVESAVSGTDTAPEEEGDTVAEGPLAGLVGILPSGPLSGPGRKPQAYAIKLQADEDQQSNAALLEKMLAGESRPRAITSPSLVLSARVLRWVILGVLLVTVGFPLFARTNFTPEASLFPNETLETVQVVNGLDRQAPVLLVFDYEPAFSGEMEAAAAPLVDHLMLNGARLTILSTSPSGPVLSEQFLARTQAGHGYAAGEQYVNMGYLAGGAAGVLGFAQSPRNAMPQPPAAGSVPAWQTPVLENIDAIQDFAVIVVLTDNADSGQVWVEQAQPLMAGKPLLMVVSAQVEPVIRPYVDSGQVKGMVSGLAGGAAYETINGQSGLGHRYWDGFSLGLLMAAILIIVGGLWNLAAAWNSRRAHMGGEV